MSDQYDTDINRKDLKTSTFRNTTYLEAHRFGACSTILMYGHGDHITNFNKPVSSRYHEATREELEHDLLYLLEHGKCYTYLQAWQKNSVHGTLMFSTLEGKFRDFLLSFKCAEPLKIHKNQKNGTNVQLIFFHIPALMEELKANLEQQVPTPKKRKV